MIPFNVWTEVFYESTVESGICSAAICRGSSIRASGSKKGGWLCAGAPEPLELIVQRRMLQMLLNITNRAAHPLHEIVIELYVCLSRSFFSLAAKYNGTRHHSSPQQ